VWKRKVEDVEEEEVVLVIIVNEPYDIHSIVWGDLCSSWCLNTYLKLDIISIPTTVDHHDVNPYSRA